MHRTLLAVAALASLPSVACCSAPEPRKPPPSAAAPAASSAASAAPEHGKLEAPVEIDTYVAEGKARVTTRFTSAATGVRVDVSGVDGLVVQGSPTLVENASYDRGAVASFDVAFTPGPGVSHLVVVVSGTFGGGHLAKVRTLAVGTPSAEQKKPNGEVVETPGGDRVKIVVPAK